MKVLKDISLLIILGGFFVFTIGIGIFDWFGAIPVDKIAFASDRDGDSEIFIMDSDGSDVKQLTFNNENDLYPSLSSNGKKIVFQVEVHDEYAKIFVTESKLSKIVQVTYKNDYDLNDTTKYCGCLGLCGAVRP